jgi:hypothetical protein
VLNGLCIKSAASRASPFSSSSTPPSPVMIITGIFCVFSDFFNAASTSNPFISGMIISSKMRSGIYFSANSIAVFPLFVIKMVYSGVKMLLNTSIFSFSSSTISTLFLAASLIIWVSIAQNRELV